MGLFGGGKRLKKKGVRCEATVVKSQKTATTTGSIPENRERRWKVELTVAPPGRAAFTVVEHLDLPNQAPSGPTAGTTFPAWVDPKKDEAYVEMTGAEALETSMNARLASSGVSVDVPEGVTDPAEMTRILSEQIEAQQTAKDE